MKNELTIGGTVYSFKFGIGFLHEINPTVKVPVNGVPGMKRDQGLQYAVAGIMDGDIDDLIRVLDLGNKTESPRITRAALEAYVEDDDTDIDALREKVIDFLEGANCCRKTVRDIKAAAEKMNQET